MKKRLHAIEILFLLISVLLLCGCAEFENTTRSSIPSTDCTPTDAATTPEGSVDNDQPEITPTDTIAPTSAPRAIEEITATPVPTNTPTPTATPTPEPTPTATPTPEPTPTATPVPTNTPVPTATPTPISRNLTGELDYDAENYHVYYVVNVNTYKFHERGCRHISKMKPDNTYYATDNGFASWEDARNWLISQGFSPCGTCEP